MSIFAFAYLTSSDIKHLTKQEYTLNSYFFPDETNRALLYCTRCFKIICGIATALRVLYFQRLRIIHSGLNSKGLSIKWQWLTCHQICNEGLILIVKYRVLHFTTTKYIKIISPKL